MHFHFGQNQTTGSEHLIDGKAFEGEEHVVFKNVNYDMNEALQQSDGIAVLSRVLSFTKSSQFTQQMVAKVSPIFSKVVDVESEIVLENPKLYSLFDFYGSLNSDFYVYSGSLTTPDCNEVVTFIIASEMLKIRSEDLMAFRKVHGFEDLLAENFRPVQPINQREVYYYDY